MGYPLTLTLVAGIGIRVWLAKSSVADWLADKNEISTPLTSWKRVTEGLALEKAGVSPYSGDLFHEMPLVLRFLSYMTNMLGPSIYVMFIVIDVLTALVLERIAKHFGRYMLVHQTEQISEYSPESKKLLLSASTMMVNRLYVVAGYLFNPYTIATCLAKSTACFNNLAIALTIMFTLKQSRIKASACIAVAAYISLYPIMLVVPTAIFLAKRQFGNVSSNLAITALIQTGICTAAALAGLLYISFAIQGSWDFLSSTYGFILSVPDLTPNIGVFWYFFTEMFEHFRPFFVCVFQINAFIYTIPLAIKLRNHPLFFSFVLLSVMAIFKSYPSYADAGLYLAMMPLWRHTFPYLRNSFVVACMFVVCSVLAPILYHLWIYAGSANANFYFAITLVYTTAQIFLLTDLFFAFLKREYELHNGIKPPIINSKPAQILLE